MDLNGKNVVYVGGFGGIGFESCKSFIRNGIKGLVILDIQEDANKLQELHQINKVTKVLYIPLDLTQGQMCIDSAFADAHAALDRFDVIVNGSGIMNEHEIERTVKINLMGTIYSTLAAMRYMDKSKGGHGGIIVNVSSLVGLDSYGSYAVYTATKYGVNGFTRALADPFYYSETLVKFITICPSTTETPMLAALRRDPVTTFERQAPLPRSLENNQTSEECGKNLVEVTKNAENGSVWILSNGAITEYKYPKI